MGGRTLSFLAAMPGFLEAHPDLVATFDSTAAVWLRDGADGLPALRARGDELGFGSLDLDDQAEVTGGVNRILRTDAVALVIAGLLAAVVGAAILHQLLRREADSVAGDLRTLGDARCDARRPRRRRGARRRLHRRGRRRGWRRRARSLRRGSPPSAWPASPSPISGFRSTPPCS